VSWLACCLTPISGSHFYLRFCLIGSPFLSSLVLRWTSTSRHSWLRNSIAVYSLVASSFLWTCQSSIFLHSSTLLVSLAFSLESLALWWSHCHPSHCLILSLSLNCLPQFGNLQSHSSYFMNPSWYSKAPFCCQVTIILV
jgi:hypothetical protein